MGGVVAQGVSTPLDDLDDRFAPGNILAQTDLAMKKRNWERIVGVIHERQLVGIYAPVKGIIVEGNKALEADPGLINREPFGQGWIFVLKIDNADDLKQLKDAAAYKKQIGA